MNTERQNSRVTVWLPILLALTLATGIFVGLRLKANIENRQFLIYPRADKIGTVLNYITNEYVDSVDYSRISGDAINAMLKDLDPHSLYIPASELQAVNEPLEGNFSGIGVQFNMQNDTVAIIQTVANGPSERVGIRPGDRIIKVDDTVVAGVKMATDDIIKKLKGPRGTRVKVGILRRGTPKLIDFEITRDQIPIYSVDVAYMINPKVGYIKISTFARTTHDEFIQGVEKLHKQGMKRLIVDLRGNGGGYMDAATSIADEFLGDNQMIVYTEGRGRPRAVIKATPGGVCVNDSAIILIDEWSASASEILAGAIQDNDRGLIVGRRSFGKGLVQEQIPLSDGSALRLTVARYYTPTGRCIQKPYKDGTEAYYHELIERYSKGEFNQADSNKFNNKLKYRTPKGRIVYGGGGIMPDVFVPLDTTGITDWLAQVRNRGLGYSFAFQYTDNNRTALTKCGNVQDLITYLNHQDLLRQFLTFASQKGVRTVPSQVELSRTLIETELKAYIARNIFDNEGFYPVVRTIDNTLEKAISLASK